MPVFFTEFSIGYSYGKKHGFSKRWQRKFRDFYPGMESVGYGFGMIWNKKAGEMVDMDQESKAVRLLMLIGVSGEMPADWAVYAVGSCSYCAALITRLKVTSACDVMTGLKGMCLKQKQRKGCWSCGRKISPHFFVVL